MTDDSWTESGLTYSARPALGAAMGTVGPTSGGTNYTVPLNAGTVQGQLGGPLSLGMDSTSSDGLDLGSRESTTPPTLVLTFSGGGTPPPGDTTAPTVTAVTPAENATGVAVASTVTATFSEGVTGVSGTTFTLTSGGTAVPATVTYNAANTTATLTPSAALSASTIYTATVKTGTTGVKDTAGNQLAADKSWTFTTAATTPPPTGGETVTLTATADTYGTSATPTTNLGTNVVLGVDASAVEVSYLKFDLGAYAGRTVTGATLQIRATTSGSVGTQNVKLVTDDSWTESGLTYSARPALGTVLGTLGPTSGNTNYTVTLNAGSVQGQLGGPLSLGLDSTSSDGVDLGSRETAIPPKLVLTFS